MPRPVRAKRVTGVQSLWRAGYKSWGTEFYRKHWRACPAFAQQKRDRGTGITDLSWEQEQNAKNVTNLLILLSVSGGRRNFSLVMQSDFLSIIHIICLVGKYWHRKFKFATLTMFTLCPNFTSMFFYKLFAKY